MPQPSLPAPLLVALLLGAASAPPAAAGQELANDVIEHQVVLTLSPNDGGLSVVDRITLSKALFAGQTVDLRLPAGLEVSAEGAVLATTDGSAQPQDSGGPVAGQLLTLRPESATFTLRYSGKLVDAPTPMAGEHQRAFSTSSGIISADGVYLPWWLPTHDGGRVLFDVTIEGLPDGWLAVLPGQARADGKAGATSGNPFAEVPLVAGRLHKQSKTIDGVEAVTLLRAPDPALSARYLDVTGQYLKLYKELIGPFPYKSFALVENFWETGYGMPGFTLLGPKVIRFPFILHSSYPHELLHNYFGNGVFLPEGEGNWCEGLTAYLADHLVAEQRDKGAEHRLAILTRYRDFVTPENDFPVRRFVGRSSPSTEAVGYVKWSMVLHMLRTLIGDDAFKQTIRDFYSGHRFQRATFRDFQKAAEFASGQSLERFFTAWLDRTGAPTLRWSDAQAYKPAGGPWGVSVTLEQTQPGAAYPMSVPIVVTQEDGRTVVAQAVFGTHKKAQVMIATSARPLRLDVDPAFETFRRLDRDEVPPRLSAALGAEQHLFVVPEFSTEEAKRLWGGFAKAVCPGAGRCEVKTDKDVERLPDDRSVWLLGYANSLRAGAFVQAKALGADLDDGRLKMDGTWYDNGKHALALAVRSPTNADQTLVFVGAARPASIAGLGRKLPHYGKYGYLGFVGDEPTNVLKGQWSSSQSPLAVKLHPRASAELRLPRAAALASLPPPFDATRMRRLVDTLAAPSMEGRGYGSPQLEQAATLVENAMKEAGLQPGAGGSYRQCFDDAAGPSGATKGCNVVGLLPGKNLSTPMVVLGAHLDGLGKGWPAEAIKAGNAGQVHPGANDNASGVAVMLEVARALSSAGGGLRSVLVVAFTGEEAGLRGSTHFVTALGGADEARNSLHSAIVLDTVGKRTGKDFVVMGGESASQWVHALHGVGFVTGIDVSMGAPGLAASDHRAFHEVGIPAIQLFAGPDVHIHTPGDTTSVVVDDDLVAAAVVTKELMGWLIDRAEPLSLSAASTEPGAHKTPVGSGRTVQTGAVPDFKFPGPGVRLANVLEGSALAEVGLAVGDVLVSMDGRPIRDLRSYSLMLRRYQPGQRVQMQARRGDEVLEVTVTLKAR
jgi:aminopeptidase N